MSDPDRPPPPRPDGGFALFLACAALVAVFLVGVLRGRPMPLPAALDAPPDRFHGAAALKNLLDAPWGAEGPSRASPHPVGSDANRAIRDWILDHLRREGIAGTVERRWVVRPSNHRAAWVENVVARIEAPEGRGRGRPAVVACAHYDSVPAGPGAGDDMSGVVVLLETARLLRAGPPLARDVVLLFTDGEEPGLLGARAYVREHGVDDVAAVVNVEARGTTGPSLMFETGPGTARTVPAWTAGASRPLTSSLFAAVYRAMPNDTDFTEFLREGVPGLNFSFIDDVQRYHTPLDAPFGIDARSLQHQGDNVLAAVRGLAAEGALPDDGRPAGELVWFDVLSFGVVRWGEGAGQVLAVAVAAIVLFVAAGHVLARRAHVVGVVVGVVAAAATVALSLGAAIGVGKLLVRTGALPDAFVASQAGPIAVAAGVAAFVAGGVGVLLGRSVSPLSLSCGTWVLFAGGGAVTAFLFPGASYLLIVPSLLAGLVAIAVAITGAITGRRSHGPAADAAGLVAAAVLLLPLVPHVAGAMGVVPRAWAAVPLAWVAAPFALVAAPLVPLVAAGGPRRWWVAAGGAVVLVAGFAATTVAAPWTSERPRAVNVTWVRDAGDHDAHWIVRCAGDVPGAMRAAVTFEDAMARVVPWDEDRGWAAEAPAPDLPAPSLEDLQVRVADGSRRVTFRLTSRRGAPATTLAISPAARLRRSMFGGLAVVPETLRQGGSGPFVFTCLTTPPEGLDVHLDFADEAPVDVFVGDESPGLPAGADEILRARPADAVPRRLGDTTIVWRKLRL